MTIKTRILEAVKHRPGNKMSARYFDLKQELAKMEADLKTEKDPEMKDVIKDAIRAYKTMIKKQEEAIKKAGLA